MQQGPNHLHAEGVRGDCLITFSTAWLKTAHKSLVHMGLATGACMGTCTVVNTAIKHNYITSRHYTASFGCQFSHYPTKKLHILIFMTCLQFIELIRNCTKEGVCHTNILTSLKYQYGHDAQRCLTDRSPLVSMNCVNLNGNCVWMANTTSYWL